MSEEPNRDYKQVIVVRKDLKMRRGKEISQGCHACLAAVIHNLDHPDVKAWLAGAFTKITVVVNSEEELLAVYNTAKEAGLICDLIKDAGLTEFHGVKTHTTVAIGPHRNDVIDSVTGNLKLY